LVDRVFITLMSCGRSETVVSAAPINPTAIIKSILFSLPTRLIITILFGFLAPIFFRRRRS